MEYFHGQGISVGFFALTVFGVVLTGRIIPGIWKKKTEILFARKRP
jgi:hypothetical protein